MLFQRWRLFVIAVFLLYAKKALVVITISATTIRTNFLII